jgi:type I restriction enzyme R subunit
LANRTPPPGIESEWLTRKRRIDPLLDAAGWPRRRGRRDTAFRNEEEETTHGPADYALWLGDRIVGIVEAKKLTIGPQNVLTQAERYARGLTGSSFDFDGVRCPFLYATNGEVIWFHDVRHQRNRSREVKRFHTPAALRELLEKDDEGARIRLQQMPHDHPRLRPYQLDANAAVETALKERKRNLLVAMATGTGKTFTIVNQIYRLMKAGLAPTSSSPRRTRCTRRGSRRRTSGRRSASTRRSSPSDTSPTPSPGTPSSTSRPSNGWP